MRLLIRRGDTLGGSSFQASGKTNGEKATVETRYLNVIEHSRTSGKPLPPEVIENVQEALWLGIFSSVQSALKRVVEMAPEDEHTEGLQATHHERTAKRLGHRNGTYMRDLHTTFGPIGCENVDDATFWSR